MAVHALSEMTWEEVRALDRERIVAVLPAGATEAHGPHLPLSTDVLLAQAMARVGAERLSARGIDCLLLPPLAYSAAPFAAAFPGTISLRPETVTALLTDLVRSLDAHGIRTLAIASSHLDPVHIDSLKNVAGGNVRIVFPDVTRKPWALRLSEEFKSGACHAGRFEGSVVMAVRPELVREEIRRTLPSNPVSLSTAIRTGKKTFEEAGGPRAYFGAPAEATAEEGLATIQALGTILEDAVMQTFTEEKR